MDGGLNKFVLHNIVAITKISGLEYEARIVATKHDEILVKGRHTGNLRTTQIVLPVTGPNWKDTVPEEYRKTANLEIALFDRRHRMTLYNGSIAEFWFDIGDEYDLFKSLRNENLCYEEVGLFGCGVVCELSVFIDEFSTFLAVAMSNRKRKSLVSCVCAVKRFLGERVSVTDITDEIWRLIYDALDKDKMLTHRDHADMSKIIKVVLCNELA